MSFLQARVEKQFQLCLEFLGPNDVVLKNGNVLVIVEHVENVSPSPSLFATNMSQKESRANRRAKIRFRCRSTKGESKVSKRAKTKFKNKSAKGESRASTRAKTRFRNRYAKCKSRACRKRINKR
jgi:hypothetical protein